MSIRWEQRFDSFDKAFTLLQEVVEGLPDLMQQPEIVREGVIQRFEYTYELAWNVLKARMEYDGLQVANASPRYVFKLAYNKQYIDNIELWLDMVRDRNLMSHNYSFFQFGQVIENLQKNHYVMLKKLHSDMKAERFKK